MKKPEVENLVADSFSETSLPLSGLGEGNPLLTFRWRRTKLRGKKLEVEEDI
jgi:hypothetical protein